MAVRLREWAPEDVAWGLTRCEACIAAAAEVTFDSIPCCVDCAEVLLDRAFGVDGMTAEYVSTLPPIFEERQSRSGWSRRPEPDDDGGRTIEDWRRENGIVVLDDPPPAPVAPVEPPPYDPTADGLLF